MLTHFGEEDGEDVVEVEIVTMGVNGESETLIHVEKVKGNSNNVELFWVFSRKDGKRSGDFECEKVRERRGKGKKVMR